MAFWNEAQLEPKRKFKFIMRIPGGGSSAAEIKIPEFVVKKASKPSFTVSEAKHQFLGHSFYFPGKLEWKEVDVTIVDAGGFDESDKGGDSAGTDAVGSLKNDSTTSIMKYLREFGYQHPNDTALAVAGGGGDVKTFSKWAGTTALGNVQFESIDSNGNTTEAWVLKNAWIKEVNFGDGDYSSDDVVDVTIKMRYDWAEFLPSGDTADVYPKG
jgi:hypothetical protein